MNVYFSKDELQIMNCLSHCLRLLVVTLCLMVGTSVRSEITTPLAASGYQQLPTTIKINQFLQHLAEQTSYAKLVTLGKSAGGRDFTALLISNNKQFLENGHHEDNKLTVLLIGSQHGTEPSGSEGLQKLALQLTTGKLNPFLDNMNFIIVANGNPDGRDNNSRFNEMRGNLNIDYVNLAYPESLIYLELLKKYQVDTLMDIHESSINKKVLEQKQGYLLNFDAQYEVGTNPNIDEDLLHYSQQLLLPELIKISQTKGLSSSHYLGEIRQLNQDVGHGGLKISNFRNYSALQGIFSVLVENRLDYPKKNIYTSPSNIKVRSEKQFISVLSYLTLLNIYKNPILKTVKKAKNSWKTKPFNQTVSKLTYKYSLNTQAPFIMINLKKVATGQLETKEFPRSDFVSIENTILMPEAYAINASQKEIVHLLRKHHLNVEELQHPTTILAILPTLHSILFNYTAETEFPTNITMEANYRPAIMTLNKGDFLVSTKQPNGKLVPLLLDFRSTDNIYPFLRFSPIFYDNKVIPSFPVKLLDNTSLKSISSGLTKN